jgi:hypothetical protein
MSVIDVTGKTLDEGRLSEIRDLLRYESSISFHSHRAAESMWLLVAEVERIRNLHQVETLMTVRPGCGEDGDCAHEDRCPEDNPVQVCGHCREQVELADGYWSEKADAWAVILWPCPTMGRAA